MRGTPYFTAPEVLSQDKFERRSDVWSCGGSYCKWRRRIRRGRSSSSRRPMALFYHVASTDAPPPMITMSVSGVEGVDFEVF